MQVARQSSEAGFLPAVWEDTKAVFLTPESWLYFTGALGLGLALDAVGLEDKLAGDFDRHDYLPAAAGRSLDSLGTGYVLLGGTAAWYGVSALVDDPQGMADSRALASSLIITGVTTLGMKQLFRDERPNGAPGGFPSGHAAMSMAAAATLGELYGWEAGLPAYLLAALVGFQRLDNRKHDLDDVIGGWTVGWVIGRTVVGRREAEVLGGQLVPMVDPASGTIGLGLLWRF